MSQTIIKSVEELGQTAQQSEQITGTQFEKDNASGRALDTREISTTENLNGDKAIRVVVTTPAPGDAPSPTEINLSSTTVSESASVGAFIGNLTAVGGLGPYTFSIVSDPDNVFQIDGNDLEVGASLDFDTADEHNVTIRVTDLIGKTFDKTFVIEVTEAVIANDRLVRFNGVDESGQMSNISEIDSSLAFSIVFTLILRNGSNRQNILSMQSQFSTKRGFEIYIDSSGQLVSGFVEDFSNSFSILKSVNQPLTLNTPLFIRVSNDGSSTAAGLDIKLNDSFTAQSVENNSVNSGNYSTGNPAILGARSGDGSYLQADINNFMVFNTEINGSDLSDLYNSGNPLEDLTGFPSLLSSNIIHIPIVSSDTYPTLTDLRGNYNMTLNANMSQSNIRIP